MQWTLLLKDHLSLHDLYSNTDSAQGWQRKHTQACVYESIKHFTFRPSYTFHLTNQFPTHEPQDRIWYLLSKLRSSRSSVQINLAIMLLTSTPFMCSCQQPPHHQERARPVMHTSQRQAFAISNKLTIATVQAYISLYYCPKCSHHKSEYGYVGMYGLVCSVWGEKDNSPRNLHIILLLRA